MSGFRLKSFFYIDALILWKEKQVFFHLFDIERRYIEWCWYLAENIEVGVYQSKLVFIVFLHKYFWNDYIKHIIGEKNCWLMDKNIFQKYQRFWHIFIIWPWKYFLRGQRSICPPSILNAILVQVIIQFHINCLHKNLQQLCK